ncbi:MAG: hypothetical protein HYV32_02280 [Candidatus Kerfeldbacteria bacterium]|nr:hypothetical protein [Candidatus Kerfeldbacteria bacterium]
MHTYKKIWFALVLLSAVVFPSFVFAAGPQITIDNTEDAVTILKNPDSFSGETFILSYDGAQDIQAMRINRDDVYYVVTAVKKANAIRLRLYTNAGEKLAGRLVFSKTDEQAFGAMKFDVLTNNEQVAFRVRTVKMNASGRPTRFLRKTFYIRPTSDHTMKRRTAGVKKIEYPNFSDKTNEEGGLALLNYQRLASGILPVQRTTELDSGCALHVEYLRLNDTLSHFEEEGNPGYTEEGSAAGQASNLAGMYNNTSMIKAIGIWTTAIYHRLPMFNNGLQSVGWAVSSTSASNYNYACINVGTSKDYGELTQSGTENNFTYYDPYNHDPIPYPGVGQTHIPTTFGTGESPDPLEDFNGTYPAGEPISLIFSDNDTVSDMAMTLTDASGNSLSGYFRAPDDPEDPNSIYQGNSVTFIAEEPLDSAMTYTVNVTGKVNDTSYSKEWSFTTE